VRQLVAEAAAVLAEAGVASPEYDAAELLATSWAPPGPGSSWSPVPRATRTAA
jgi:hypothetical protein